VESRDSEKRFQVGTTGEIQVSSHRHHAERKEKRVSGKEAVRKKKEWRPGQRDPYNKANKPVIILSMKPIADALAGMYEQFYRSMICMMEADRKKP
jgi:hypothetical protein